MVVGEGVAYTGGQMAVGVVAEPILRNIVHCSVDSRLVGEEVVQQEPSSVKRGDRIN